MRLLIARAVFLATVCLAGVSQGAIQKYPAGFAHVAFGYTDATHTYYWTTQFVFRNDSNTPATVTFHFFSDSGQPLSVPVVGGQRAADQTITIPANGSAELDLDPTGDNITAGWVAVDSVNLGVIKGQGIFVLHYPDGKEAEAVVSMVSQSTTCIGPQPSGGSSYSLPFDNTNGRNSTYAFANTTSLPVTLSARFFDPNGAVLGEITQDIPPLGHTAFGTRDNFQNKKGTLRIDGADIIPLGFRFHDEDNTFTTWLER